MAFNGYIHSDHKLIPILMQKIPKEPDNFNNQTQFELKGSITCAYLLVTALPLTSVHVAMTLSLLGVIIVYDKQLATQDSIITTYLVLKGQPTSQTRES